LASVIIAPSFEIKNIAKEIIEKSSTRHKDALHLACAIYNKCEYFITCDDQLIRAILNSKEDLKHILNSINIMNPIDFTRKEMNIDVIGTV